MNYLLVLLFQVLWQASGSGAGGDLPLQNPHLYEGDILADTELDRNAIPADKQRWPEGRVPYQIDPYTTYAERCTPPPLTFAKCIRHSYCSGAETTHFQDVFSCPLPYDKQLSMIQKAMSEFESKTCIRFVKKEDDEKDFVLIFAGRGCYSKVGRAGGVQALSFGKGCFQHPTLVHELGHAIGFFHEHTRSDRDDYINIHWSAIMDTAKDQFYKLNPTENRILDPFDYDSIMLYGERTFSKDGWTKTMTAKEKGRKLKDVYDKEGLSDSDVRRIRKLYECNGKASF